MVPVEQFTARSGVEKWKPDESCSGESAVTEPWWKRELSTRGAIATTRPIVQSGRFRAESSPVVDVVDEDSISVTVDNSSVGGMTIRDGPESDGREHPASATETVRVPIAAVAQITRRNRRSRDRDVDSGRGRRFPYPCTVPTPKIVLFYVFVPLPDPEAIRLWQLAVCESLGVRGRIIVSRHGINSTVGGDIAAVKRYVRTTRAYPGFAGADIKWSDGTGRDFPRLSVRVRPEIVTFGVPDEIEVDENGVVGTGTRLSPEQVHELVDARGDDVVFFDGRNEIEAEVGRFAGAVTTKARTTRDFVPLIESGAFDHLKDRPIVTYCTGGVRCEVLSTVMRNRGFAEVYQLDGGIVRYGERYGDDGLWQGSLYVFDDRMGMEFSDHAEVLGRCVECRRPTSNVANHPDRDGRDLAVICADCLEPDRR